MSSSSQSPIPETQEQIAKIHKSVDWTTQILEERRRVVEMLHEYQLMNEYNAPMYSLEELVREVLLYVDTLENMVKFTRKRKIGEI